MERQEIYDGLNELIPASRRRKASERVCEELGMNALLDELCLIQLVELADMEATYEEAL
jgi:hypothetical protein